MKRFLFVLLIVVMLFSFSISSLGAVASFSDAKKNIASNSNAIHFQDSLLADSGISVLRSDDLEYGTDWDYTAWYSDSSGNSHSVTLTQNSDGSYSATAPGTYDFYQFRLNLYTSVLPSSGTYGFSGSIRQGHIDYNVSTTRIQYDISKTNVDPAYPLVYLDSWDNTGEEYNFSANIQIVSNMRLLSMQFILDGSSYEHLISLGSPDWSFTLSSQSGATDVSPDLPDNTQNDIASGVDNIASGVDSMQDTLKEIVQTISLQLEALWNQLYNYIHVPQLANDDKNTGLITDSIDTMGSDVVDSVDSAASDITSNADSNAQAIQDNADQNTNTITNGYDNSGIDSDNDRLSDKLDEYGQQEDELMEDVSDGLSGIDFDVDFDSILSSIQLTSDFLQDLYDASGGFKLVINCALLLSFASCAVGLYRLKGGG